MQSGRVDVSTADGVWKVEPHTALLMRPEHERKLAQSRESTEFWSVGFEATLFGQFDLLQSLQTPALWHLSVEEFSALETLLAALVALDIPFRDSGHPLDGGSLLMAQGLGRAVVGLCWKQLEAREQVSIPAYRGAAWFPVALEHLRREPGTSVAQWARAVGFSPAHFRRVFQACAGLSPQDYLTRYRIDQVRTLLRTTDLSVAAAADRVGFKSQTNFLTLFRRATGQTPTEYRRSLAASLHDKF
jgi:AraC-like DNA-binding protein